MDITNNENRLSSDTISNSRYYCLQVNPVLQTLKLTTVIEKYVGRHKCLICLLIEGTECVYQGVRSDEVRAHEIL